MYNDQVVTAYKQQVQGLVDGGAHIILVLGVGVG